MRLSLPLRILPFCIQLLRAFLYMRILRSAFAQRSDCLRERLFRICKTVTGENRADLRRQCIDLYLLLLPLLCQTAFLFTQAKICVLVQPQLHQLLIRSGSVRVKLQQKRCHAVLQLPDLPRRFVRTVCRLRSLPPKQHRSKTERPQYNRRNPKRELFRNQAADSCQQKQRTQRQNRDFRGAGSLFLVFLRLLCVSNGAQLRNPAAVLLLFR